MKKERLMELAGVVTEAKQKNKFDVILKHKGHPTVTINRGVDDAQAQRAKKALEELIKMGGADASVEVKKVAGGMSESVELTEAEDVLSSLTSQERKDLKGILDEWLTISADDAPKAWEDLALKVARGLK